MRKLALALILAALLFLPKKLAKQKLENKVDSVGINSFAFLDTAQVDLGVPAIPLPPGLVNPAFYDLNDDGIDELIGFKNSFYRIFQVDNRSWKEIFKTRCPNFEFLAQKTNGYYDIKVVDKDTTLYRWNDSCQVYEKVK